VRAVAALGEGRLRPHRPSGKPTPPCASTTAISSSPKPCAPPRTRSLGPEPANPNRQDGTDLCHADLGRHPRRARAEAAALLHPDDAQRVHTALTELGYTFIPEEPLWQPYDGVWDPAVLGPSEPTWWIRYFDYL
jgi:hypothetical protein